MRDACATTNGHKDIQKRKHTYVQKTYIHGSKDIHKQRHTYVQKTYTYIKTDLCGKGNARAFE